MSVKIRVFNNSSDREQVKDLWIRVFGYKDRRNDPGFTIDKKLSNKDDLFLVAEESGKIIGTVMGGYDGHRGWIYSLAVDRKEQNRSVGTQLLKEIEKALTSIGCFKINLQLLATNENTKEFYMKNGYKVEERVSMGKVINENIPD